MLCYCLLRIHRFAGSAVRLASVLPVPASSLNRKQVEKTRTPLDVKWRALSRRDAAALYTKKLV